MPKILYSIGNISTWVLTNENKSDIMFSDGNVTDQKATRHLIAQATGQTPERATDMNIVAETLHSYKDGDTFIGVGVQGDSLVIGETRNEEHAAEGTYTLHTVIPLAEAIAIARAVLAAQMQAEQDAWVDEMYARTLDRAAMVDDALESDIRFWRENAYVAGAVKLEPADMLPV